jgi:glycosyltransferase involved in cell wall biosynthesis
MITGVILARNEAANIVECLQALRPHVQELILIDMESEDQTVELAKRFVQEVISHPKIPNFDVARNVAIDAASHEWLWYVDADERIPEKTGQLVRELVDRDGGTFEALYIPFKSYFCGKWIQNCGWWPGYTMPRVLKRGFFHFREELHSGVHVDGRTRFLPADPETAVDHFSYRDIEHYLDKFNPYTSTEAQNLAARSEVYDWELAAREMTRDLWSYYERGRGAEDGSLGWILSWLGGQYRWFARSKLVELGGGENPSVPDSIDHFLDVVKSELSRLRGSTGEISRSIVLRTPLWDYSGYADDGRQLAKSLAADGRFLLRCEALRWNSLEADLSPSETTLLRALCRAERDSSVITITNGIPGMFGPDPDAAVNILRTTFETDRIPVDWLPHLKQFDEVWVFSEENARAFRQGGAAPEQLRIVPSAVDTDVFKPAGTKHSLPEATKDRFVFLSSFDWQLRKGWDVLLRAYCQSFSAEDDVALLLKVTTLHHQPLDWITEQVNSILREFGDSMESRPDIVLWIEDLSQAEMAAVYRASDAFVLPTRGEGWGRPYMEAMACGLPVIATRGSGQMAFLTEKNSVLVESTLTDVDEVAAREIPVYEGHQWWEPDLDGLRKALRKVRDDSAFSKRVGRAASRSIREQFSLASLGEAASQALEAIVSQRSTQSFQRRPEGGLRVQLEGEVFSGHSFSNINETMAIGLDGMEDFTVAIGARETPNDSIPPSDGQRITAMCRRQQEADVVIRHAFPPDWSKPTSGYWIHIQPWEFGFLPKDWIQPLRDHVDEIWAPSQYVKDVYTRSGIDGDRVHVIPWGIDADIYNPQAPPRLLSQKNSFAFLFVGGTIARKGFDLALTAYLEEFSPTDDVSFVVKDLGANSFYRFGNFRAQVLEAMETDAAPHIIYLDDDMTDGQRASLYTACDCLVMPYRGEGFGLPILEAMACGLPAIIPGGGPSDDFAPDEACFRIPATIVETDHDWRLCGPAVELDMQVADIRKALRAAYEDSDNTKSVGEVAAKHVSEHYTWKASLEQMRTRIHTLCESDAAPRTTGAPTWHAPEVSTCLLSRRLSPNLPDTLASVAIVGGELLAVSSDWDEGALQIASEAGARLYDIENSQPPTNRWNTLLRKATKDWNLILYDGERLETRSAQRMRDFLASQSPHVTAARVDIVEARTGNRVDRDVRLVRNATFMEFALGSGYDFARAANACVVDSDLVIEVRDWHPTLPTEFDALHSELASSGRDIVALHRLGRMHMMAGNPFHAECYLEEVVQRTNSATPEGILALQQLLGCYEQMDAHYWAELAHEEACCRWNTNVNLTNEQWAACSAALPRLYLGAGVKSLPGYVGVDVADGPTIGVVHNLDNQPWPWEDNSVAMIVAEDVVEHLQSNLIEFCNEAWRVLAPGGEMFVRTPHHDGASSWIDPTHRWHLHEQSFEFLDPQRQWGRAQPHYVQKTWQVLSLAVRGPQNICATLAPRKEGVMLDGE